MNIMKIFFMLFHFYFYFTFSNSLELLFTSRIFLICYGLKIVLNDKLFRKYQGYTSYRFDKISNLKIIELNN